MSHECFHLPPADTNEVQSLSEAHKTNDPTDDCTPTENRGDADCNRAIGRFCEQMRYYSHQDREHIVAHLAIVFQAAAAANSAIVPVLSAMVTSFPHELLTRPHYERPVDPDALPKRFVH